MGDRSVYPFAGKETYKLQLLKYYCTLHSQVVVGGQLALNNCDTQRIFKSLQQLLARVYQKF